MSIIIALVVRAVVSIHTFGAHEFTSPTTGHHIVITETTVTVLR